MSSMHRPLHRAKTSTAPAKTTKLCKLYNGAKIVVYEAIKRKDGGAK